MRLVTPLVAAALAAPALAHAGEVRFIVTDLGRPQGTVGSSASGLNDAGQVITTSLTSNNTRVAAVWSQGSLRRLEPMTPDASVWATGINSSGAVIGTEGVLAPRAFLNTGGASVALPVPPGSSGAFAGGLNDAGAVLINAYPYPHGKGYVYRDGMLTDLGHLGQNWGTSANAINNAGTIVGSSWVGNVQHAFVHRNGAIVDLGSWGGASGYSTANAISQNGLIAGTSWIGSATDERHAFLYVNGVMRDLGALGTGNSLGQAVNNAGQVVGSSTTAQQNSYTRGFISSVAGGARNLNDYLAGSPGFEIRDASGINQHGQISASGINLASSRDHALLLTPTGTIEWKGPSGGSFGAAAHWDNDLGFAPTKFLDAVIFSNTAKTVHVTDDAAAKSLAIGGSGNALVTLNLTQGARLETDLSIRTLGKLTGHGTVAGNVSNFHLIEVTTGGPLAITGNLFNDGAIVGGGQLRASLYNTAGGALAVNGAQTLELRGAAHASRGLISVAASSEIDIAAGRLLNHAEGTVRVGGVLRVSDGLDNLGRIELTNGAALHGAVVNATGATIALERLGQASLFDALTNDGSVSAGSSATLRYLGAVDGDGEFIAGTGAAHRFEGRLAPGHAGADRVAAVAISHAEIAGTLGMDIGGLVPGTGHDHISFSGALLFDSGSVLGIDFIDGFSAQLGDSFDLFDFTQAPTGAFDALLLPTLGAGLVWDTSDLYAGGSLRVASVTAVPEPQTWALLLAGLGGLAVAVRRRAHGSTGARA